MFFLIMILVLISVYVVLNEKVSDSSKTGWFVVLAIVVLLYIVFGVLLGGGK